METYAALLKRFRSREHRSRNNLAKQVGVDPSYLTRIEHGDREPPRLHIVQALNRALNLSFYESNLLLVAAGHPPENIAHAHYWDEGLEAVFRVLNSPLISLEEKTIFSDVIKQIALKWMPYRDVEDFLGN